MDNHRAVPETLTHCWQQQGDNEEAYGCYQHLVQRILMALLQVLGELATQERLVMHQVAGRRDAVSFATR